VKLFKKFAKVLVTHGRHLLSTIEIDQISISILQRFEIPDI